MNFLKNNTITFFFLLFFLLGKNGMEISAQTMLQGMIVDSYSGKVIKDAEISLSKNLVYIKRIIQDSTGFFSVEVESGRYELEVISKNYPKYRIVNIKSDSISKIQIDILLEKAHKKETVIYHQAPFFFDEAYPATLSSHELRSLKVRLPRRNINDLKITRLIGKVTDKETGEEMIGANVVVTKNGVFIQGQSTDIDGNFNIRVDPATYKVEVSYTGYATKKLKDIIAIEGQSTKVDVQLEIGVIENMSGLGCGPYWKVPLLKQDETTSEQTLTSEQIRNRPVRNIKEISLSTAGVSFSQ